MDTNLINGTVNQYIQEEISILNADHGTDDQNIFDEFAKLTLLELLLLSPTNRLSS